MIPFFLKQALAEVKLALVTLLGRGKHLIIKQKYLQRELQTLNRLTHPEEVHPSKAGVLTVPITFFKMKNQRKPREHKLHGHGTQLKYINLTYSNKNEWT